jgi:hypothetical protein
LTALIKIIVDIIIVDHAIECKRLNNEVNEEDDPGVLGVLVVLGPKDVSGGPG